MCILPNVKKHEKTFALNVDIFILENNHNILWTFLRPGAIILKCCIYEITVSSVWDKRSMTRNYNSGLNNEKMEEKDEGYKTRWASCGL